MQTKVRVKPKVTIKNDFSRGQLRYLFIWEGYNRELFDLLKQAGAKWEKPSEAINGITWCSPTNLKRCLDSLSNNEYVVHTDIDLTNIPQDKPIDNYNVVRITDRSTIVNLTYGPKFDKMIAAIKQIHLDDREFDPYTKDWKILHRALPTLIWGWKEIGLDVQRLEAIKRLVG